MKLFFQFKSVLPSSYTQVPLYILTFFNEDKKVEI